MLPMFFGTNSCKPVPVVLPELMQTQSLGHPSRRLSLSWRVHPHIILGFHKHYASTHCAVSSTSRIHASGNAEIRMRATPAFLDKGAQNNFGCKLFAQPLPRRGFRVSVMGSISKQSDCDRFLSSFTGSSLPCPRIRPHTQQFVMSTCRRVHGFPRACSCKISGLAASVEGTLLTFDIVCPHEAWT